MTEAHMRTVDYTLSFTSKYRCMYLFIFVFIYCNHNTFPIPYRKK